MTEANSGDTVKVHYTGRFEDGTMFDSSAGKDPLQITLGEGEVIPGFEEAVTGMKVGEKVTVYLPVEKAYGPPRPDLIESIQRKDMPDDFDPVVGKQYQLEQKDGQIVIAEVTAVTDDTVTLNANHPLAGKALEFEIQLVEILE
jgi:FKBP-type peptidyl-prolyl cis-trans isomerase 2